MGRFTINLALITVLLLIFQPFSSAAAQQELSEGDVRILIINTAELVDEVNAQISSLQSVASQIQPCPCPEEGTDVCSDAAAAASSVLSMLQSRSDSAKAKIQAAANDYNNEDVPLSVAVKDVGDALAIISNGITTADSAADSIPSSCPDENNMDICPFAKNAVSSALSDIISKYGPVKSEYDRLAGMTPQLTPEQQRDKEKNDRLLSVYANLGKAQRMRDTINNMEQSGASEADLLSARMQLSGLEQENIGVYESILSDSRYKFDFWTNWDYATLKKNRGDTDSAMVYYAIALSSTNVDEKTKVQFLDNVRTHGQSELNLQKAPPANDKVVKSISQSMQESYDNAKLYGYSKYMDYKIAFFAKLAKVGKAIKDVQQFEEAITGKSLEASAAQAASQ